MLVLGMKLLLTEPLKHLLREAWPIQQEFHLTAPSSSGKISLLEIQITWLSEQAVHFQQHGAANELLDGQHMSQKDSDLLLSDSLICKARLVYVIMNGQITGPFLLLRREQCLILHIRQIYFICTLYWDVLRQADIHS